MGDIGEERRRYEVLPAADPAPHRADPAPQREPAPAAPSAPREDPARVS